MTQVWIPAAFYRGGSSKGVFFHARHLPIDRATIDRILLDILGSPDPYGRQLDGMGGGISSLSKAAIIGPSTHREADVDYTFAQIAVDAPVVDWGANCGNLSSVVGPFCVDEDLIKVADGEALVRIHQVNTSKIIHARFSVQNGQAVTHGSFAIAGVAGTGARIRLDFLSPGGSATRGLLPTGNVVDCVTLPDGSRIEMSLIDASNPVAYVRATDLALTGTELPAEIEAKAGMMARLDTLRRHAGVLMGLGTTPDAVKLANPKIAIISAPAPFRTLDKAGVAGADHEIGIRMLSMASVHRAVTLTGALCTAVACRLAGSIPNQLCSTLGTGAEIRVGNPSGVVSVGASVRYDNGWIADSVTVSRTARRLRQGTAAVRSVVLAHPL
jgi:2-methylaconitate cis-trans-isomerase PrpF